ncbi:MAG: DNA cytosine methyltransferase [Sphingomonadales bacterium]
MAIFYEFFAGGGMARAGLGESWKCVFANDFDPKKVNAYKANWGHCEIVEGDVAEIDTKEIPGAAELAWASFPCQDLSLAGGGAGLKGDRSGVFWPFWELMCALNEEGRAPRIVVLENVCGTLTSHGGADFRAIASALSKGGYRIGALVIDAVHFVPQSRPRLFLIGLKKGQRLPNNLRCSEPMAPWHTKALVGAFEKLTNEVQRDWVWWQLPEPPRRNQAFQELIEDRPQGVVWHTPEETANLLGMMSDVNMAKVDAARISESRRVGAIYKRTRRNSYGRKVQRAEVRFDDVAGCLRTPAGGSSRQIVLVVEGENTRSRLLSPREAARLMGLPDEYNIPESYNEAYHLVGDGVVAPVVRFLAENILEKLLKLKNDFSREAA